MVLFVIFKALIDKTMYDFVCPYLRIGVFMTAVGQGNFVASACVIFGWCVWMWAFDKEWNNKEMFDLYHQRLDCDRATRTIVDDGATASSLTRAVRSTADGDERGRSTDSQRRGKVLRSSRAKGFHARPQRTTEEKRRKQP